MAMVLFNANIFMKILTLTILQRCQTLAKFILGAYLKKCLDICSTYWKEMTYNHALAGNPSIINSARISSNRNFFFHRLNKSNSLGLSWEETNSSRFLLRIYRNIYRFFLK